MLKIAFLFMTIFMSASYGGDLVFLTSLPKEQLKTTLKLNKIIQKKLSKIKDHKIVIINNSDQETLYKYLNSPKTISLVWLGHGAFKAQPDNQALRAQAILLDYKRDNIAKVFQRVHPNIKFLSIVGCNSSQIVEPYILKGQFVDSYIPDRKVIATWALRKAIRKLKRSLSKISENFLSEDIVNHGYPLEVVREITTDTMKSVRLIVGGSLVGILPRGIKGDIQRKVFYIQAKKNMKRSELKVIVESGQSAFDTEDNFGNINLSINHLNLWTLFSKANGEPFGTNERIFLFNSEIINIGEAQDYALYSY